MFFCSRTRSKNKLLDWQIIEHFGYPKKDIFIVDKPIIAKTLYVTPQNEMYGQVFGTSEYYLDLLDKNYPPKPLSMKKKE